MALRDRIAYLRKEHKQMLQIAEQIESALALGARTEFSEHQRCLSELRALEHGFQGIEEHCHAEERVVESIYHHFVKSAERQRLGEEHREIMRGLADFREDLRFATADSAEPLRGPGMAFVARLRSHIAHEDRLLRGISKSEVRRQRASKKKAPRRAETKRNIPMAKENREVAKETSHIPYTMEPHPEL